MKLFYTRKEVDIEVGEAVARMLKQRAEEERLESLWHEFYRLQERVDRIEGKNYNCKCATKEDI